MDMILEILQALSLVVSTAKNAFELWREHKHKSDDVGR